MPPPQLTLRAILLGVVLSVVFAAANAYLGLFAGLTVSASIPAAVAALGVLKLFPGSHMLEANIVQTAASAGESLAAGVIFTLPALVILGYWSRFDYAWVTAIAGIGGALGVLFTIPLRRSLIVEQQLPYPEGTATAEVLRIGAAAAGSARALLVAAIAGGLMKLMTAGFRLWPASAQAGAFIGNSVAYVGMSLSPALLGVGYIVGLEIGGLVLVGGLISWLVAIPAYAAWFADADPALVELTAVGTGPVAVAYAIWSTKVRYLGVGAMLVGGIGALVEMRSALWSGVRAGLAQRFEVGTAEYRHTEHDVPMRWVLGGIALFVIPLLALYGSIVGHTGIAAALTVLLLVAGFLFSAVAAYMAGLVGSSNNPVSGITIATILFTSLLLLILLGESRQVGPAAAIMVGAVVCCAAAIGGDNLQDLKTGHLLGATPWRQQVMQTVGVLAALVAIGPVLNLLLRAYGIGAPTAAQPNALLAPQATLMASVADGVFGGGLPWTIVLIGALIGLVVIVFDRHLRSRGSSRRVPVLAVAVGMYLPLELSVSILLGALIARRVRGVAPRGAELGVLFSAGMITGEALVGIAIAVPVVVSGDPDVWRLPYELGALAGLPVFAVIAWLLAQAARGRVRP